MLLSKACEYGLRATLHLSTIPEGDYVSSRAVSEALGLPYPFLAKVVQTLAQADLLASSRGAAGGVRLAHPPGAIRLRAIVEAIDGPDLFTDCVLGLPGCGDRQPCPLHQPWTEARARIAEMFDGTTLGDLAERVGDGEFRLGDLSTGPA